jgi:folate-binding protein YgfZ
MNDDLLNAPWLAGPRDVVTISGPDAATYLQSQISQDIRNLQVGQGAATFLLQPTGKVEVLARVQRAGDQEFRLDTDPGFGEIMLARLQRFKIRVAADLSLEEDVLLSAADTDADALEALRIAAGWPKMGAEIVPGETIPAETGVIDVAVSFTKGCYPGQELVERMDSRGSSAPRRVVRVHVAPGTIAGDPYMIDGQAVGTVTSVAGTEALALVKRSALAD